MKTSIRISAIIAALSFLPCLSEAARPAPTQPQRKIASELPKNAHNLVTLAPGLTHFEFSCRVNGHDTNFEELRMDAGNGVELRVLPNPYAAPNSRCRNGYGGPDLPALLSKTPSDDFTILGATNGTFFRSVERREEDGTRIHRYASNHFLWSKGAGLVAPLRQNGGQTIFIADTNGGRDLRIHFERCGTSTCARLIAPYPPELSLAPTRTPFAHLPDSAAWASALTEVFPTMTLAIQSNLPLTGGVQHHRPEHYAHYTECPTDDAGNPKHGDWRCSRAPRTLLCGRTDGSVSILSTPGAYPYDVAVGLKQNGSCQAECKFLHNLDGGGSTQMGHRGLGANLTEWKMTGSKVETAETGCSPFRPVDHYLILGLGLGAPGNSH